MSASLLCVIALASILFAGLIVLPWITEDSETLWGEFFG